MEHNYILTLEGVGKSFPGVKALDQVSFQIERGSIHALVGENGAGKSTLIKILAGIYQADEGQVILDGKNVHFRTPHEAHRAHVSVVHQEIKLAEPLSVTENIFIGNLLYKHGLADWKEMRKRAAKLVQDLQVDIDVDAPVETLTVAKKQIVEICKAINREVKILIMDEPSAVLTDRELDVMFGIVEKLKKQGITIIYISHRMGEIFQLSDQVTVLRDGKHIGTLPTAEVTKEQLIAMMIGRELGHEYVKEPVKLGETVLEVKNLVQGKTLKDISFSVKKGEVFGISGLVGAGRTELVRAILGIDKINSGEIFVKGKKVNYKRFQDAIRDGLGLAPEDRKMQGLVQIFDVKTNVCMVSLDKILKRGVVRKKLERQYASEFAEKLHLVAPSLETQVQYLSGGNQQKVVLAKWLLQNSDILFLDEPTRGIDVGAKSEIYQLISDMVQEGKTVIMISSELPEILGMCDRVMVMHEGNKTGELSREEATQAKIMALCVDVECPEPNLTYM